MVVIRVEPVQAPLGHVAVQVVDAEGVRRVRIDRRRAAEVRPLLRSAKRLTAVEVRLEARQRAALVERAAPRDAGAAGVLPLRLARQAVKKARFLRNQVTE